MNTLTSPVALSPPDPATDASGYELDLVLWCEKQAGLLRARQFDQLDLDNLIEELEAMANRDRRELRSRLRVLIMHLLKHQFQPEANSRSWASTIRTQRHEIEELLEQSPSLERLVPQYAEAAFNKAVALASDETGLPRSAFPDANPYSRQELLDEHFLP